MSDKELLAKQLVAEARNRKIIEALGTLKSLQNDAYQCSGAYDYSLGKSEAYKDAIELISAAMGFQAIEKELGL